MERGVAFYHISEAGNPEDPGPASKQRFTNRPLRRERRKIEILYRVVERKG
jgi:hypothetical protein